MSTTKPVPKPTPMGGFKTTSMAGGNMRGKASALSGGTTADCPACGKATKPVSTPKAM